jgi:hypothetical protein
MKPFAWRNPGFESKFLVIAASFAGVYRVYSRPGSFEFFTGNG